eukprot:1962463-Pyramimonas_sp.AAC.1
MAAHEDPMIALSEALAAALEAASMAANGIAALAAISKGKIPIPMPFLNMGSRRNRTAGLASRGSWSGPAGPHPRSLGPRKKKKQNAGPRGALGGEGPARWDGGSEPLGAEARET